MKRRRQSSRRSSPTGDLCARAEQAFAKAVVETKLTCWTRWQPWFPVWLLPGKAISYIRTLGSAPACVIGSRLDFGGTRAHRWHALRRQNRRLACRRCVIRCAIVPAAMAMGERSRAAARGSAGIALGYDVAARLNMSLNAYEFREDGHSTHSFGPAFGAAAAAGSLVGLNYDQSRHLLSYTAQQASGVSCWMRDEEHIEKAFDFGGMPARSGVAAAAMVSHGMSGVEDVFSGERNFFVAYGRAPTRNTDTRSRQDLRGR
jgi:hypothetical protein